MNKTTVALVATAILALILSFCVIALIELFVAGAMLFGTFVVLTVLNLITNYFLFKTKKQPFWQSLTELLLLLLISILFLAFILGKAACVFGGSSVMCNTVTNGILVGIVLSMGIVVGIKFYVYNKNLNK